MEEIRAVCPYCEAERSVHIVGHSETIHIRKDDVSIEAEFSICTVCGNEFVTLEQMDANLASARAQYRSKHSIITPEEIVEIRRKYAISQKAFGKVLGVGELTINSYESGILPSAAHDSLIRLASIPENFSRLYAEHRSELSMLQQRKIEKALAQLQEEDQNFYDENDAKETVSKVAEDMVQYHGKMTASLERMYALMQLLLGYAGSPLYKMALLKLLFYCDFSCFKHYKTSITGWSYARLPYGPVPDNFAYILYSGEQKKRFTLVPDEAQLGDLVELPDDFNIETIENTFSPNELDIIRKVVEKLGKIPASILSRFTHEEEAWTNTSHAQTIPYYYATSLKHGV